MVERTGDAAGCFKLLAAIIDNAVEDFEGGFLADKRDAAAFFRGKDVKWMCDAVGATVGDLVECRLTSDPFKPIESGRAAYKATCPGALVEYKGRTKTLSGWSMVTNVTIGTLRARIKRWGVCDAVFYGGRVNKFGEMV